MNLSLTLLRPQPPTTLIIYIWTFSWTWPPPPAPGPSLHCPGPLSQSCAIILVWTLPCHGHATGLQPLLIHHDSFNLFIITVTFNKLFTKRTQFYLVLIWIHAFSLHLFYYQTESLLKDIMDLSTCFLPFWHSRHTDDGQKYLPMSPLDL